MIAVANGAEVADGDAGFRSVSVPPLFSSVRTARSAEAAALVDPKGAMASASSAALWKRSSGRFSRQRSTASSRPFGRSRRKVEGGGGASMFTIKISSVKASARKGTRPVRSW